MRIISYNVNGIRAACRKGFLQWLASEPADILCLQEIKALYVDAPISEIQDLGYKVFWYPAQKKGYSGVALLSKVEPLQVKMGQGISQSDAEGRVLQADFADFYLVNTYFPSGSSGEERQAYKMEFLADYLEFTRNLLRLDKPLIIVGDYNICHRAIDIHDPIGNKNSSGFLPEERAWFDQFFALGMLDSFRYLHPEQADAYSWWSYRSLARERNKGWRIDYISVSKKAGKLLQKSEILNQVVHSDHCPVLAELAF